MRRGEMRCGEMRCGEMNQLVPASQANCYSQNSARYHRDHGQAPHWSRRSLCDTQAQ